MRIRAKELRQLWKRKEEVYKARTKTAAPASAEAKAIKPVRTTKKGEE